MSDEWTCTEIEYMEHDGVEVQTWTHNGVEVYSAGKMVTYMVDSGISYQEKVKKGQSCLAPTTFTPSKSGWTFAGWREDSTASGSVLSEKVMERSPITLYAVFKQTITLSYNGNGAMSGSTASQSGTRYYNNGGAYNPSFTLRSNGFGRTYYNFQKWALNSAGGTQYSAGASITLSGNATMYAIWKQVKIPLFPNGGYSFSTSHQNGYSYKRVLNVGSDKITSSVGGSTRNYGCGSIFCNAVLDVTNFSKITVDYQMNVREDSDVWGYTSFGLSGSLKTIASGSSSTKYYPDTIHSNENTSMSRKTETLDISSVYGNKYFEFYCGTNDVTIYSITIT